jgi:hypothetical protein
LNDWIGGARRALPGLSLAVEESVLLRFGEPSIAMKKTP